MGSEKLKKVSRTKTQALDNSDPMASIRSKLKKADPEIQHYVAALEMENLKLHKTIAKLQVENISLKNRIAAYQELSQNYSVKDINPEFQKMIDQIINGPNK